MANPFLIKDFFGKNLLQKSVYSTGVTIFPCKVLEDDINTLVFLDSFETEEEAQNHIPEVYDYISKLFNTHLIGFGIYSKSNTGESKHVNFINDCAKLTLGGSTTYQFETSVLILTLTVIPYSTGYAIALQITENE